MNTSDKIRKRIEELTGIDDKIEFGLIYKNADGEMKKFIERTFKEYVKKHTGCQAEISWIEENSA